MSKKLLAYFLPLLLIPLTFQSCTPYTNNCIKCNPTSNLCIQCVKNIYKPNVNGGCEISKNCNIGQNYCSSCNSDNLCSSCELGFYPDENGGCATTEHCLVSYDGECLQCADDFYLLGNEKFKYCKYKFAEDIKNCQDINIENGKCENCTEGFYKNFDDFKCTSTENCRKSLYEICSECNWGFYLDKRDDKCKDWENIRYCKISIDGENCDECIDNYYLSKNGKCITSNFCERSDQSYTCQKCAENYYLSSNGNTCTNSKNCETGDNDYGLCKNCQYLFYLNVDNGECVSNQENNDFKFCKKVEKNKCVSCMDSYSLTADSKCTETKNCSKSNNGVCSKCDDGYRLTIDNKCTNIEHCYYPSYNGCYECDKNYYFDEIRNKCYLQINQYKNCKIADYYNEYCKLCEQGYYLYGPNKLCYNNSEEGSLYRCERSNENGTLCDVCQGGYYLGLEDYMCTKIEGCLISENENKCTKCDDYYCFDINKGTCIYNDCPPEAEKEKIYYACNKTNEEGTECALCRDEFFDIENGICVNKVECKEEENGKCVKCNEKSHEGMNMCLNNVFGCVETLMDNCLRCDNMLDFDECTECDEGYEFNDNNQCVEK